MLLSNVAAIMLINKAFSLRNIGDLPICPAPFPYSLTCSNSSGGRFVTITLPIAAPAIAPARYSRASSADDARFQPMNAIGANKN